MRKLFSIFSFVLILSTLGFGQPAQVDVQITAVNGPNQQILHVGLDQTATTGIDATLGEGILPPPPPTGAYDIRFDLTPYGVAYQTWRDYRNVTAFPFTGTVEHKMTWQLATGATTLVFNYEIPTGAVMNVKDPFGGGIFNSGNLTGTGSYTVGMPTFNQAIVTMTYTNVGPIVVAPIFGIAPAAPLAFGTINVGANLTLPATITNSGTAPLTITNITSSDAQYTFTSDALPITVGAGLTTGITVTFTPTASGLQSANLVFTHNAAGSPTSYALTGTGHVLAPVFGVTPGPLTFGTVNTGTTSAPQNLTVTNTGDANLTVTAASGIGDFIVSPATLQTIIPGGNCVFAVTFAPTVAGPLATNITFTHNAGAPVNVAVSGIGHTTAPFFTINPASLPFGLVSVGQSATLPVTVTNDGDANLVISGVVSSNAVFTFAPGTFPITLAGGANQIFNVTFTPTTAAVLNESLTFTHNAGAPVVLPLSGTGRDQGGQLIFEIPMDTVLDGTNYTRSIMLHGYSGQPLKALQFDLILGKTNGFLSLVGVQRGTAIGTDTNAFKFSYKVYPGAPRPDGSSIDRIKVVILGMGTNEIPIGGLDKELMKFTYHVVQITGPHAETWNSFENVTGATSSPVHNANIDAGADQHVTIHNGTPWGLLGDVNLDDHVDLLDILLMIDYILGNTTFNAQQFAMGDIAPWVDLQPLPVPDGVINVMDLAVLEHIVMTGTYPSGIPVYKITNFPMQYAVVQNKTDLTPGMNAKLTFRLSPKGISVVINSAQKIKGLQMEFSDLNSLIPVNSTVSSSFSQSQFYQNNSALRILAYDSQSHAMNAGEYLVASLPFTFMRPEELKINEIIVADENNHSMDKIEVEVIYEGTSVPTEYMLYQNYPNPFNPSTLVRFSVPKDDFVTIKVYDMVGQEVTTLYSGLAKAGVYTMNWNGKDNNGTVVSSGSYLYRMIAGDFVQSKKMMFLK